MESRSGVVQRVAQGIGAPFAHRLHPLTWSDVGTEQTEAWSARGSGDLRSC